MSGNEGEDGNENSNLRVYLKIVRDETKTAFDLLPNGQTIGEFANRQAVSRYSNKIKSKRVRRKNRASVVQTQ